MLCALCICRIFYIISYYFFCIQCALKTTAKGKLFSKNQKLTNWETSFNLT